MTYAGGDDPLCYPGTSVLINKLNISNQSDLDEAELALFLTRSMEAVPPGSMDAAHYRTLHHHLFQDVYAWAGQYRTIRIGKDGNWFCYPEYIRSEMDRLFDNLKQDSHFVSLSKQEFITKTTHFLAELNAVHPFREGNGRTQLTFLIMLVENAGYVFNDDALEPTIFLQAMIASFNGNEEPLREVLEDLIAT